jgi:SAM-dependent methyltransferase
MTTTTDINYAGAGMSGAHPKTYLFEADPQYDRHGNLRNPDQPDTTELDPSVNDGMWLHRDLLAHQLRWGFVGRTIRGGESILDFGCGSKMPLGNTLNFGLGSFLPSLYVGVDYGKFHKKSIGNRQPRKWEGNHRENFDATDAAQVDDLIAENGLFTLVTSFEVVEHIFPAESVSDYFANAYRALVPGGRMLVSTPIVELNSKGQKVRARNHVHEFTAEELERVATDAGFTLEARYGTFANFHDIKRALIAERGELAADAILDHYFKAREFYGDDTLACFLAPVFPLSARNQFLVLRKPGGNADAIHNAAEAEAANLDAQMELF